MQNMHTMQDMQYIHYMYNMLYMHDMYNTLNMHDMHDMQNMLIYIIWTPPFLYAQYVQYVKKYAL
jgi:hypothetical protein